MQSRILLEIVLTTFLAWGQAAQTETPTDNLPDLYEEGLEALTESNWDLAIDRFQSVLDQDESHQASLFYLSVAYDEAGRTDDAIAGYQRLLAGDETIFEARINLGALLAESGRLDEALVEIGEAMEQAPNAPEPVAYYAQILDRLGRRDEAIAAYQRLIEVAGSGPLAAEAYRNMGSLYLQNGAAEEAYGALSRSVALGVDEASVHAALGDLAFRDREPPDPDAARRHYERALAVDPDNPELELRHAIVLIELDRTEEALASLEGISAADVSVSQNDLDAVIGDIYLRMERFPEAVATWSRVVELAPQDVDAWATLGVSYRENGQPLEAILPLERAIALDPDHPVAVGTLASVYHQLEDWTNAVTLFEQYVGLRPGDATALHSLAVAYDRLQNYPQALVNYNRFLELDDGTEGTDGTSDARRFQTEQRVESLEEILPDN